mmetsp:Transcript_58174/g.107123  ORF Transcript_58174/g.107123 Transcript_58174/m.107123 type:complete len:86 (+) Transcript_58174:176-433(+)
MTSVSNSGKEKDNCEECLLDPNWRSEIEVVSPLHGTSPATPLLSCLLSSPRPPCVHEQVDEWQKLALFCSLRTRNDAKSAQLKQA